jgi:hypothetical protein
MHEMGHALGLDHDEADPNDLMSDTLVTGERRLPDASDMAPAPNAAQTVALDDVVASPLASFLGGPSWCDAFDFSALFASIPSGDRLEANLDQAFAHVKEVFAALLDAHHGEHPLADFAAQLHDGPVGDILNAVLPPHTPHQQADWLA